MPQVLVQEYLPGGDGAVDWIADVYCGRGGRRAWRSRA